jgi:phospholipid/cholesterol/gamma-HCH transport system substrate-binding protein
MPRTRSLAWSELKIGVLTIGALVITALTIFMLTGNTGFFWQRYNLKARFTNVAGLNPGSPVRVAGIEVGTVSDVILVGEEVEVVLEINEEHREHITSESVARIGSVSLLGESAVDITPSTRGTPIPDWGYVASGKPAAALADITDSAGRGINELTALITDIRQGRGTVGKLMTDDQLYAEINRMVTNMGELTRSISQGNGTLGRLINDPATVDALNKTLGNLQTLTAQLNAGEGSMGKLLRDDAFAQSLTATTNNLQTLTARINSGEGTMGKLMNDAALYNRLDSVVNRLDQVVDGLNAGQGTMGQLLKDRQLYENMNRVTTEISGLVAEIKKDPKKYLNVRVSIF